MGYGIDVPPMIPMREGGRAAQHHRADWQTSSLGGGGQFSTESSSRRLGSNLPCGSGGRIQPAAFAGAMSELNKQARPARPVFSSITVRQTKESEMR